MNNDLKLNSYINDCINIENNINTINEINENINKYKNYQNIKIDFIPQEKDELIQFIEKISTLGSICNYSRILEDSLIINNNSSYINNIINWINSEKLLKDELLYRRTRDGDSFEIFHKLCNNQGQH